MSKVTTIGDRVKLKESNLVGVVRFIGEIKRKKGIFFGIELDEKKGKNDGSMWKIAYFRTTSKRGIFIEKHEILKTNSKHNQDIPRVTVGDTVYIKKFDCNGIIRYIGSPEFQSSRIRSKSLANTTKKSSVRSLASNSTNATNVSNTDLSIQSSSRSRTPTASHSFKFTEHSISNTPNTPSTPTNTMRNSRHSQFILNNIWYGIELEKPTGKNNGTVQDRYYFECKPKYGIFLKYTAIEVIYGDDDEKKSELIDDNNTRKGVLTPKAKDRDKAKQLMDTWNWKRNENKTKKTKHGRQRSKSDIAIKIEIVNEDKGKKRVKIKDELNDKKKDKKDRKSTLTSTLTPQRRTLKKKKERKYNDKNRSKSLANTRQKTSDRSITSNESNKSMVNGKKQKTKKKKSTSRKGDELKDDNENKLEEKRSIEIVYNFDNKDMEEKEDEMKYVTVDNYDNMEDEELCVTIGDKVRLKTDNLEGTVKFVGSVRDKKGIFYGIELNQANRGKNNGDFRDKYYFKTDKNRGIFVKKTRILAILNIDNNHNKRVTVGDTVYIQRFDCNGIIRFIGNTSFKKGIWYGIELEAPMGKNNGSVANQWYFQCEMKYGTFIQSKSFIPLITTLHNNASSLMDDSLLTKTDTNRSNGSSFGKTDSLFSAVSSDQTGFDEQSGIINVSQQIKGSSNNIIMDILMTENDLAGFCLIWMIGLILVIILRMNHHSDVIDTRWISIIAIPVTVCLFTWIFSYIITKYRVSVGGQESMRFPHFYIPFLCKTAVAMIFFGCLMIEIKQRVKEQNEYGIMCDLSLVMIWFYLILAVITSEIFITTVMVNSIKNIDHHKVFGKCWINIFLFITRPILWVYNRLIVIFVSFYCYYYLLFGVGPICLSICKVNDIQKMQKIGISTLLLPFHNVLYLFEFEKWTDFTLSKYNDCDQVIFAVIQQVLIFTTICDLIMDIWSLWIIYKMRKTKRKQQEIKKVIDISPKKIKKKEELSIIPESGETEQLSINSRKPSIPPTRTSLLKYKRYDMYHEK